jgi:hypothetical protein
MLLEDNEPMAPANKNRLILPIQASHIEEALIIGRQDGFYETEMNWLEENNTVLWVQTGQLFKQIIDVEKSLVEAEASVSGRLLANRSVRLSVNDSEQGYKRASENYKQNRERYIFHSRIPGSKPQEEWNTEDALLEVFRDESLVAALMQIKHNRSRHSAAVSIGYFCLAEIPEVTF